MTTTAPTFDRLSGIGGSDAAAAVGLSPWKTPYELWREKTGEVAPPDLSDNDAVHFGTVLEDVVAQEFARRTGNTVRRVNEVLRHETVPHLYGHIDRRLVGVREGLECKTASLRMAKQWGEQGTDDIPIEYAIQASHYLAITGFEAWHVAVLIAGSDFRVYRVVRDEELIGSLVERERTFWRAVEERTPPDIATLDDAKARWPFDRTPTVRATAEIENSVRRLAMVRGLLKELEAEDEKLQVAIKSHMGDAGKLLPVEGERTLVTWKSQTATRLDIKALAAAHPNIAALFERESPSRVFRLSAQPKGA
jgi:putative phage-type endonuclease